MLEDAVATDQPLYNLCHHLMPLPIVFDLNFAVKMINQLMSVKTDALLGLNK